MLAIVVRYFGGTNLVGPLGKLIQRIIEVLKI
jgi:hypothetical protein